MSSTPLAPADNYHVGLVVPDIASATGRLTAISGYAWTKPVEATLSVTSLAGTVDVPFSFVYSIEAPHLEVIQEVPGTIWSASPNGAAHHLGYWVDDLPLAAKGLQDAGFVLEARPSGEELSTFAYFLDPHGVRIEIVDRALFPDFAGFLEMMRA